MIFQFSKHPYDLKYQTYILGFTNPSLVLKIRISSIKKMIFTLKMLMHSFKICSKIQYSLLSYSEFNHRAQKAHVSKVGEDWGGDTDEKPMMPIYNFA